VIFAGIGVSQEQMLTAGETYSESFPATAESVPSARAAVIAFAQEAGAKGEPLHAIRLAASEAITNAVQHAYRGMRGPIHVTASYVPGEVWVLISDSGSGLRIRSKNRGLGLGLALIAQLADEFEILSRGTGGTELRMLFKIRSREPSGSSQPRGSVASAASPA
jgi:anti-sigma regulatory factor (Ser/Thr protein kinase)